MGTTSSQWRRSWFQWEQSVVQQMLDTIGEFQPKQNKLDDWAWNLNVEKKYVVRELVYEILITEETMKDEEFFKQMKKLPIPSKVKKVLFGGWHVIEFKLWIT